MADLTPDLQVCLSWGSTAERFHSLQSLSVSYFHVIIGFPGPRFPSTCRSKADLTAPLEHSTCPYQRSLLSFRMRSRSSIPSHAIISLDPVVTMSCGMTLQICLIIALSFLCWRFGFVNGQGTPERKAWQGFKHNDEEQRAEYQALLNTDLQFKLFTIPLTNTDTARRIGIHPLHQSHNPLLHIKFSQRPPDDLLRHSIKRLLQVYESHVVLLAARYFSCSCLTTKLAQTGPT